jgi:2-dehydro-3-deoxyphosphogalactonate aldolase
LKTVLPPEVPVIVTGGITPDKLALWRASGATGFGLGGALYRPGIALGDLKRHADDFVLASRQV